MIKIRTTIETSEGLIFNSPLLVMSEAEFDQVGYHLDLLKRVFDNLNGRIEELEKKVNGTPTS